MFTVHISSLCSGHVTKYPNVKTNKSKFFVSPASLLKSCFSRINIPCVYLHKNHKTNTDQQHIAVEYENVSDLQNTRYASF